MSRLRYDKAPLVCNETLDWLCTLRLEVIGWNLKSRRHWLAARLCSTITNHVMRKSDCIWIASPISFELVPVFASIMAISAALPKADPADYPENLELKYVSEAFNLENYFIWSLIRSLLQICSTCSQTWYVDGPKQSLAAGSSFYD
jgi:hypothetical protein